jgi:adenylylsulfate kinase
LPGSGKTTIAKKLLEFLARRPSNKMIKSSIQPKTVYLSMDQIRPLLTWPQRPKYTNKERDTAYNSLVTIAKILYDNGLNVVIDATAHRSDWRNKLRSLIGDDFVEVYVQCKPEVAMRRETRRFAKDTRRRLYKDALTRLRTGKRLRSLGVVPGVDVPYEAPRRPEVLVRSDETSAEECASKILEFLCSSKKKEIR